MWRCKMCWLEGSFSTGTEIDQRSSENYGEWRTHGWNAISSAMYSIVDHDEMAIANINTDSNDVQVPFSEDPFSFKNLNFNFQLEKCR